METRWQQGSCHSRVWSPPKVDRRPYCILCGERVDSEEATVLYTSPGAYLAHVNSFSEDVPLPLDWNRAVIHEDCVPETAVEAGIGAYEVAP